MNPGIDLVLPDLPTSRYLKSEWRSEAQPAGAFTCNLNVQSGRTLK